MWLRAELSRFARDERAAVTFEAIWVMLFVSFFIAPTVYLFRVVETGLDASWNQRMVARNEALNDNCSGYPLYVPALNVSATTGVNAGTGFICSKKDGETSELENALGKFWKKQDEVTNSHFANFTEDMRDDGEVWTIEGESNVKFTRSLDLGESSPGLLGLLLAEQKSSILAPSGDTWKFDKDHWKQGHDKRFWREFTHSKHKEMFANVFPSKDK